MQNNLSFIQALVNEIEVNISEDINIVNLAKTQNISPWHFQRLFKSLVGDTLGGYVRGRRLTRAAQLLLNSEKNIIDIAFTVGFNSHEAFTRSFRSYFNISPNNYRKNKTSIFLKEKPLLTLDLIHHLAEELNQDPEIVLKKSCTIIGFETTVPSPFIYQDGYCDLLYPSWKNLFERQGEIKSRIPGVHYGLSISNSGDFTEESIDYMAGVPVTTVPEIPFGMVSYLIPEQLVAIFDVSVVEKDTAFNTIDYIYGYWLPNSPYQRGQGNDYEYFENIHDERDSDFTSKYVIPIVPK